MRSRCIAVLGVPRSGTSAVAGLLHQMGVHMGDRMPGPTVHNAKGYFEDARWHALCVALCGDRYAYREIDEWPVEQMHEISKLARQCSTRPLWGIKDPRLCFTLQHFMPYLPDPRIVVVRRNRAASSASLWTHSAKSDPQYPKLTHEQADVIIAEWIEALDRRVRQFRNVPQFEVEYEGLVSDPGGYSRRLAHFCASGMGLLLNVKAGADWIDAELNHHA